MNGTNDQREIASATQKKVLVVQELGVEPTCRHGTANSRQSVTFVTPR